MSKKSSLPARERLLEAANELFYDEGIHTVGIDRVIEKAGVAKASLYSTFGSKEELVRAYLTQRHQARVERIEKAIASAPDARGQLLAIFGMLGELFIAQDFHGCAFVRASAEGKPGTPVKKICDDSRAYVKKVFTELGAKAGAKNPAQLTAQLMLLYDGSTIGAQMDRDATTAETARTMAATLINTAIAN